MATERRAAKRNRNSAKRAGARLEIDLAAHLRQSLGRPDIQRQDKNGKADLGDIAGVRLAGRDLVLECKNTASVSLTSAYREAQKELSNRDTVNMLEGRDPALIGVVVHKRHGVAAPGSQWVTMTVDDLVAIIREVEGALSRD